jgi:hypothetical protein
LDQRPQLQHWSLKDLQALLELRRQRLLHREVLNLLHSGHPEQNRRQPLMSKQNPRQTVE